MFCQGTRVKLGIDTPDYCRGTQATVVYVSPGPCETCPTTYRVRFDDGVEWPFLERQLHHAYRTFEETIEWATAQGHSVEEVTATLERLLNEGHLLMNEEMRLIPTRELHERAIKHKDHWHSREGR